MNDCTARSPIVPARLCLRPTRCRTDILSVPLGEGGSNSVRDGQDVRPTKLDTPCASSGLRVTWPRLFTTEITEKHGREEEQKVA